MLCMYVCMYSPLFFDLAFLLLTLPLFSGRFREVPGASGGSGHSGEVLVWVAPEVLVSTFYVSHFTRH